MNVSRSSTLACLLAAAAALAPAPAGAAAAKRALVLDDLLSLRDVEDPQLSPDGEWVAYSVRSADVEEDRSQSDVWMARWDGSRNLRLTTSPSSEDTPRFSPDGRWLAFLSDREGKEDADQVWLLDRAGGEAERITRFKGEVEDLAWSPDGRRLALIVSDPDPDDEEEGEGGSEGKEKKTRKPIVIDRFQFKLDEVGYLREQRRHLYLFDLATRKETLLTPGEADEALPAWSPDGRSIAFVSKRGGDPDRHDNWDVYVIEAREGARPRPLTANDVPDNDPEWESPLAWSPDGKSIAYLEGGPQKLIYYAVHHLAVVPVAGGASRRLAPDLDRNAEKPRWSEDGRSVLFLLEDDRAQHLASVGAAGGRVERPLAGNRVVRALSTGRAGRIALLAGTPEQPNEVFALEGSQLRPLSRQNDALMDGLRLATTEGIELRSADGTPVHGFIVKPLDYKDGRNYPTILRIHGGPVAQYGYEFQFEWQLFAARGYAVVGANPRGSSGRGEEFATAIYADWGNRDAKDVLAAMDHAVTIGVADPERLGIGGWSYGGILTNYTIARDPRFKAAVSGASISNVLAGYGTDQYIREYEQELGAPWTNPEVWLKLSFPFLHADRIVTPTLFVCGESDFNVPLLNSEQMYQALRSLGRETRLVIYPGQYHAIRKPSYKKDRLERYLAWYDRFLRPDGSGR